MGKDCFVHTEIQLYKIKNSGAWLHNNVNVLHITELYTYKMVKMVNSMLCIFYHRKIMFSKRNFLVKSSRSFRIWYNYFKG